MIKENLISFIIGVASTIVCSKYKFVKNITVNKRMKNIIKEIEGDKYVYPMLKIDIRINNQKCLEINKFNKYIEIYEKINGLSNISVPKEYDIKLINDLIDIYSYILNKNKKDIIRKLITLIEKHNEYSHEVKKFIESTDNQDKLQKYIPQSMAKLLCEKNDILYYKNKLKNSIR